MSKYAWYDRHKAYHIKCPCMHNPTLHVPCDSLNACTYQLLRTRDSDSSLIAVTYRGQCMIHVLMAFPYVWLIDWWWWWPWGFMEIQSTSQSCGSTWLTCRREKQGPFVVMRAAGLPPLPSSLPPKRGPAGNTDSNVQQADSGLAQKICDVSKGLESSQVH